MPKVLRWTVSVLFLVTVIAIVEVLYYLLFGKPSGEPLKTLLIAFSVILGLIIADLLNRYRYPRGLKRKCWREIN
jgi:membrane protein YdbS with pleckstrin-like domain